MEASMNVGIRPIERPQSPGAAEGIGRRGDGGGSSAAFSPKTNVSIQNAVDDMAGILAKIANNQMDAVEKMPADLQKLIQNVMKQAFSLEETLAQGLGSTLESQRFSMEQLSAFSRMLTQMGKLMDRGMTMEVSDTMQVLLTNLKNLASTEQGASLEPVLLTKAAFELLDNKPFTELPKEVQQLLLTLQPQGMVQPMLAGEGNSLAFLKQLVQYFMPRPASGSEGGAPSAPTPQGQPASQNAQGQPAAAGQAPISAQGAVQSSAGQVGVTSQTLTGQPSAVNMQSMASAQQEVALPQTAQGSAGQTMNGQPLMEGGQQPAAGQSQQVPANPPGQLQNAANPGQTSAQNQVQTANGPAAQGQQAGPQGQANAPLNMAGQSMTGNQLTGQQGNGNPIQDSRFSSQQFQTGRNMVQTEPAEAGQQARPQQTAMQQAKNQLMNQVMENTPQTMNALRDLAQLLLKDGNLTQKDALLMQSFVNGKEALLSAKEAQQLQQLIRLCQANVPATIQQAALQQNIPDLPRLWAFMQLCDMAYTRNMTARQLKKAGKDVATFVLSMRNSMEGDNSIIPGQRSLNFMMPMYMGEESTYPAYIHVYDEKQPDPETGEMKKETWLRLCVLTDNIGAVELTCRVYRENQLDMRLFFSSPDAANEFRAEADALRSSLKDSKLSLKELKIGAVGERRFM